MATEGSFLQVSRPREVLVLLELECTKDALRIWHVGCSVLAMSQAYGSDAGVTKSEEVELEQELLFLAGRAREAIVQFVKERPHAALGVAAAAGFIIGGGLTPRRLVRLGLAMGGPSLTRQIASQAMRLATESWALHEHAAGAGKASGSSVPDDRV